MHERRHPNCLNCGAPTPGEFCGACGQRNTDLHVSLRELVGDVLSEAFDADARIVRTVKPFLLRPGFLTNEHNAGRRVRYSSPLRLYLFCSVAYFLVLSLGAARTAPVSGRGGYLVFQGEKPGEDVHLSGLGALGRRLEARMNQVRRLSPEQKQEFSRRMQASFVENLPKAMFVLVPLAALLLQLLFWRAHRFYVEHLTFALHLHALAFFVLLLAQLLVLANGNAEWPGLLTLAIPVYGLLALRNVYRQGWGRTLAKGFAFAAVYGLLLTAASSAVAVAGFLFA